MRLFITRDFLIRRSAAQRGKVSRPVQINLEKPGGFPMSFSPYIVKICSTAQYQLWECLLIVPVLCKDRSQADPYFTVYPCKLLSLPRDLPNANT